MEEKEVQLKIFTNQNEKYMQILIALREQIGWIENEPGDDKYIVPFILTCASALECSLNDYIIKHYSSDYHSHSHLVDGYLSINFRGKLTNIVSILTNEKFIINTNHKTYQTLLELIRVRNRLVHNKSDYDECTGVVKTNEKNEMFFVIPEDINNKLDDYSFGIKRPIGRFQDAIEEFYEKFYYTYKEPNFIGNDLILAAKNA